MAVAPLFVADMNTLKSRLRMTGSVTTDGLAIIDKAVEDVRVGFYDEAQGLGASLVTDLLAIAFVENATNPTDLKRTRANNLEVTWVRLLLMRRIPMLFMDGSAVSHEVWNEEPLTRSSQTEIQREVDRLENDLAEGLAALLGETDDQGSLDLIVFEPDTTPDGVGDSIKPLFFE